MTIFTKKCIDGGLHYTHFIHFFVNFCISSSLNYSDYYRKIPGKKPIYSLQGFGEVNRRGGVMSGGVLLAGKSKKKKKNRFEMDELSNKKRFLVNLLLVVKKKLETS